MAKDKEEDEEEEEEEGGGKKKLIMGVGGVVVLGAVYNFVLKSPAPVPDEMAMETTTTVEPMDGEIVELEEMILNIRGDQPGYLRIGLAVVLQDGVLAADFEPNIAIAKDIAVQYLSAQTSETLRTPEGRQMAKEELSLLLQEAYGTDQVVRVLFTALVMQ